MEHYAGIDVSLKESSVCVVDAAGKLVREVKVASEPEALIQYFAEIGLPMARIGLEAGPLSQWLRYPSGCDGRPSDPGEPADRGDTKGREALPTF